MSALPLSTAPAAPLSIDIAGGGPTGLLLALALRAYGVSATVRVFDPRWRWARSSDGPGDAGRVVWRDAGDGNRRREQIVTLQSNVWQALPPGVQSALFDRGDWSSIWPCSADSPEHHGQPRNLPIRDIEDRLLELLQRTPGVEFVPECYDLTRTDLPDVLAICDGAHSPTREHFVEQFGRPHSDLYRLNGQALEETLLGLEIAPRDDLPAVDGETNRKSAAAVLLTVAQNRYLLNANRGRGFLNVRLSRDEAREWHRIRDVTPDADARVRALRASRLWPIVGDGLKLFDIDEHALVSVRGFRCALVHRPRFVAQIARGTWGCLLGDAANALHFWPGRGLNTGFKSALSLARCLARRPARAALRDADLCEHEGVMQMLQAREVGNRSWQTMLMCDADGRPRPIDERIRRAQAGAATADRSARIGTMVGRLRGLRERLASRLSGLPDDAALVARLERLGSATLDVLVETGAWVTEPVGGAEVDVAALLPLPRAQAAGAPARLDEPGAKLLTLTYSRSRTDHLLPAVRSRTDLPSPLNTTSTRRFNWRPVGLSLPATG